MHEDQAKEISEFDSETSSLGIDPTAIYTVGEDFEKILGEGERASLSGMSISSSRSSFNTQL